MPLVQMLEIANSKTAPWGAFFMLKCKKAACECIAALQTCRQIIAVAKQMRDNTVSIRPTFVILRDIFFIGLRKLSDVGDVIQIFCGRRCRYKRWLRHYARWEWAA